MQQAILILAFAGAAGLTSPALAQQGQQGQPAEPPQAAAEPAAAQAPADQPQPRSPEETFADHLHDFMARVEARKQANENRAAEVGPQQEFRYHPAW